MDIDYRKAIKKIIRFLKNRDASFLAEQTEQLCIEDVCKAIERVDRSYPVCACAACPASVPRPLGNRPVLVIIEQPVNAFRFRYRCEFESQPLRPIPGVSSTHDNKTYPTFRISNYIGKVIILVSLVTKDEPYRVHPHDLVGKHCVKGICSIKTQITEEIYECVLRKIGIQITRQKYIVEALAVRQNVRVDPFGNKFDHKNDVQSIDLKAVRLCFQVFLPDETGRPRRPLTPIVSDVISNKKYSTDLRIRQCAPCSGSAKGGTSFILQCSNVTQEGMEVVFYQKENGVVVWEERARNVRVHNQAAIDCLTPAYQHPNTNEHVNVYVRLKRLKDNARSNSIAFEYIPEGTGSARQKLSDVRIKKRKVVADLSQ